MESEMLLSLIVTVLFGVSDRVSCGNSMMSIILPPTVEVFVERTNRQGFEQKLSMKECMKSGCQTPSLCYLPHPTSCFKFIMCKPGEKGEMYVETMPCGFGTMWQHQEQGRDPVCDRYDLVACPNESCSIAGTTSYDLEDENCRTYMKCSQQECRLGAIPNDPSRFKMLDSAAEIIMPCSEDKQLKIQLVRKGLTVGVFVGDGELITFQKTQDLRGKVFKVRPNET
ncbi:hypothetical protein MAR_006483 [Mya arenaria]|uniref:Chitin-binding type-2 domain-containing protein n=1 Tax=Mya arenaria TaxID=6604 RepID=A0ABY7D8K8_MYAAR|nr:hypothetical protein MAR_006483 [Mya arenaria]